MDAKLVSFGEIEIDGQRFTHDVVVEAGRGPGSAARDRRRSTVHATVTPRCRPMKRFRGRVLG